MALPAHLILTSLNVGGMEKRLVEIWCRLARGGEDVRLVIPNSTYDLLRQRPDLSGIAELEDRITRFQPAGTSFGAALKALWPIVRSIPRGATVHYVLHGFPIVHRLLGHRIILSWVATRLQPLRWSRSALVDWAVTRLSFAEAHIIDVLNPSILDRLMRVRRLRRKLRLTAGGTFVDLDHFRPANKRNDVVYLGYLQREKNALLFFEAIPHALDILARHKLAARFKLLGGPGDEAEEIKRQLAGPAYRDLPVMLGHTVDPQGELAPAKLFMSLQRTSNYPSKALAEAMACGCVPIITDTGESRLMADENIAEFVPADVTPDALGATIGRLLALPDDEFAKRSEAVRAHAERRFNMDVQAGYFADLYRG